MKKRLNGGITPVGFILNLILIINVLIVLYPVLFTVSSSLTKSNSLAATSVIPFTKEHDISSTVQMADGSEVQKLQVHFEPAEVSLYQYRRLLTGPDNLVKGTTNVHGTNYKKWYMNTLKIACMNTIITVFVCCTAGYIFSRFDFSGRKQLMASLIVLQMFPSFIGMVATYVILWKFNALNTLCYFDTMPNDIAEAAYIDGASPLSAYLRVILPTAKPQIIFLALTSFTGPWMDYIFPRLILRTDDKKTLAVGLYEMISGRANDNFTMFAAGAILVAVPFTILFMAGQRTLLMSLAGTSGKE